MLCNYLQFTDTVVVIAIINLKWVENGFNSVAETLYIIVRYMHDGA